MSGSLHDKVAALGAEADLADGLGPGPTHPEALRQAVDAVRGLIAALRVADAPEAELERVAALAREATDALDGHAVPGTRMQGALRPARMATRLRPDLIDVADADVSDPGAFFPYSPILGPLNPVAPPAVLAWDGERVRGTVTCGPTYVGPPDMVHGGVIALLFDDLLGSANVCSGMGGFTGTLTVRYERPTPLDTELQLESWIDTVAGRKITTKGTITLDGQVTARAEGIFIRTEA